MNEDKDYLYYFWLNRDEWLKDFEYLGKDEALKGLTTSGFSNSRKFVNLYDFDLETLMCAQDIIKCKLPSTPSRYKKFNNQYSSQVLKDMVERILAIVTNERFNYVSNGTLILAMYYAGYKFQRIPNTPNCIFNVPNSSYKKLEDFLDRHKI